MHTGARVRHDTRARWVASRRRVPTEAARRRCSSAVLRRRRGREGRAVRESRDACPGAPANVGMPAVAVAASSIVTTTAAAAADTADSTPSTRRDTRRRRRPPRTVHQRTLARTRVHVVRNRRATDDAGRRRSGKRPVARPADEEARCSPAIDPLSPFVHRARALWNEGGASRTSTMLGVIRATKRKTGAESTLGRRRKRTSARPLVNFGLEFTG